MKNFVISNMGKLRLFVAVGFVISLFNLNVTAQNSATNFSGTWVLNEAKSKFGDSQFRMAAATMIVKQEGNNFTSDRTQPGFDGGEMKTTEKLTLDGKVCENTGAMDSKRKSTAIWSTDNKSLVIATTLVFDMGGQATEMKSSETWKFGENNATLLIETSFAAPDGEMKTSLVYDKK
jgi:hypothetical protein